MNQSDEGTGSLRLYAGALVLGMILTGCAGGPSQDDPSWTVVPITDVSMVAGEWGGSAQEEWQDNPRGDNPALDQRERRIHLHRTALR